MAQTGMWLHHCVGIIGAEHEPRRTFENEMTQEEVEKETGLILRLHFQKVDKPQIFKALQTPTKRLGAKGKEMVRTVISGAERESAADVEDARQFLGKFQKEDVWVRFQLDEDRRVARIAWALDEQQGNALRYSSIIIQDNTFNTNEYKYHLALIVVVDNENYTQIAMQALLANERTEDFKFLFRVFRELCEGVQPEVIFTDADQAAMTAIDEECPASHQKLCLFHMDENLMKHGRGLEQGVLAGVEGMFHAAALLLRPVMSPRGLACSAPFSAWQMFLKHKANLFKQLKPDSHMYNKYMADFVFEPRQAVSGTAALQTVMPKAASPLETVTNSWLEGFDYVRRAMRHVECSAYAMKDMSTEALAAMAYDVEILGTGNDDVHREIARMVSDPAIAGLSYDPTSGGGDGTWTTRTSVKFFAELLEDQVLDKLVRITRSFSDGGPNYGHLVALGPDGFVLCTCLRLLVYGLGCRHGLRAVRDTDFGLNGGCIASRWRDSTQPWTMEHLTAKRAAPANTAAGVPGDMPPAPMDPGVFSHSKPTARASNWASCVAFGKELASLMTDVDAIAPCQRVLNNLTNYAKQLIEVEARSQHEATTNRIFTGVVARPVTATDPPEGGPVGAGPGGGRGRGNGRGRGRGGAGEGGGRGSRARRGRGGEGLGVSAASTPSLAVGGPALPQADGPGSTGGGGEGGGSGLGDSAAGTPSLAENLPSHRAGVAGAAMDSFPTPTNATRPVGGSGAPLRSLSNSPHDGVGQTSPGVTSSASLAFDATNSCAPESFQQSRLNGERLRAHENHGQPLPSTPHNVAFLDEVRSPPKRKQTGPTKRRKSTAQRNNRGGGQHVIQGGAEAVWGI
ncbi:unnamed protein product [Ectocarpus sp. CCAP 1310/34]|nr:unnamed protein product [Ectocarpus sp. CCAP 1310/34]